LLFGKISGRKNTGEYFDVSSIESGLLFGLLLPPDTSLVIALIGVLFGSIVVKQFFGGAGSNILNPPCAARLFLGVCFPSYVTGYSKPLSSWFKFTTLLTPSVSEETLPELSELSYSELFSGLSGGGMGMSCAVLILLGFVFMAAKGTIRPYAPAGYILTILIGYPVFNSSEVFATGGFHSYVAFVATSGVVFVAVFFMGDYTTMPSRFMAGIVAGIVCGLLTLILDGRMSSDIMLTAPVVAVNFMSFVFDYFSKTISRRGKTSREVDVL